MKGKTDKDFIATMRGHGVHVTFQRLAIYQALYFTNVEHPSVETIYQQVKKRFPIISLGTVYKSLEKFYEAGLIQKVGPMIGEVTRYEAKAGPHSHMVCLKCQSIQDADIAVGDPKISVPEQNGFHVVSQQVILHGYCPACKGNVADS
jgi:Fur family peroxide stress response transcriptional regulator